MLDARVISARPPRHPANARPCRPRPRASRFHALRHVPPNGCRNAPIRQGCHLRQGALAAHHRRRKSRHPYYRHKGTAPHPDALHAAPRHRLAWQAPPDARRHRWCRSCMSGLHGQRQCPQPRRQGFAKRPGYPADNPRRSCFGWAPARDFGVDLRLIFTGLAGFKTATQPGAVQIAPDEHQF